MSSATQSSLLSLEQALALLLAQAEAAPILEQEWVALAAADTRVLAEPLLAPRDMPPWANSAMDGYALRYADWRGAALAVSQRIQAGSAPQPLQPGTCARIFTGAPMPAGADTVVMQENAELDPAGQVLFSGDLKPGQNVRPQGQECTQGEVVLPAGSRLGPIELGLAASLGYAAVPVKRQPRVAVLSTGDELVEPGQPLGPGQIYNSNRQVLISWLERLGCAVVDGGILPDDLSLTRAALHDLAEVDLILSTGGVSVGEADYLGQVLREDGELTLWKLAIKPGKPLTCGQYRGVPVMGLPGNPASTLVTFGLLARPYLLRRLGVQRVAPLAMQLPAGFSWSKPGQRREYLRARIEHGRVVPYANQSSGVLRSAAWAEGLAEVMEHSTLAEGDSLRFIPLSELLG
ncbi:gephyrin-like molybdotransferase Glp [Pseudomonas sp. 5P_3.1_Bac2]|uniref:molybdopterin molybdotransferase MoeA n=1 Tax=Pseudomonas sp. 5P_3.1_Bac2 TaxID=2971617 RepID=UPI0021CAA8F8|nr:gephyrin-like molybdotransferase Glp [Pseudomonas sp. 5P_3.1_Bac2]MCU1716562.1 molybdopterin molybdotransferase MoeA [Pseudomonas sp. 5P_3.1_Bac2]